MFKTFSLSEKHRGDIGRVLEEFEAQCTPVTHMIYERYLFNKRVQEPSKSVNHYLTDIIKQAGRCQYGRLQDELVRDHLVIGIQNDRIREKLISKNELILTKAIQLLKSSEATQLQARDMAMPEINTVKAIMTHSRKQQLDRVPKQDTWGGSKPRNHVYIVAGNTNLKK